MRLDCRSINVALVVLILLIFILRFIRSPFWLLLGCAVALRWCNDTYR